MAMSVKQKQILNQLNDYIPALRKGQIGRADGGDILLGDLMALVTGGDIVSDGSVPFAADLDMDSNKIVNLDTPSASGDATNKSYVDTLDAADVKKDGSVAMTGALAMGAHKVTGLASGTATTDAMAFGQILVFNSTASSGGAATEALTVTGLLAADTILAVSQKTKGANSTALIGWTTQIDNGITGVWTANPGASAVVQVLVKR